MFNITLKRPLVTLAVTAGLLVAAAGPASASPSQPPHTDVNGYTHMEEIMLYGFQGGCGSTPTPTSCAGKSTKDQSASIPASARAPLSAIILENVQISS